MRPTARARPRRLPRASRRNPARARRRRRRKPKPRPPPAAGEGGSPAVPGGERSAAQPRRAAARREAAWTKKASRARTRARRCAVSRASWAWISAASRAAAPASASSRRTCRTTSRRELARPRGAEGGGLGLNLPPLAPVDFAKFGPVATKPLSRIKKLSGAFLHRNWVTIPHVTQHDEADITELEAFRKAQAEEAKKSGIRFTMLGFLLKASVVALQAVSRFQFVAVARWREPDRQELLPHRRGGRHAERPRGAGDPRRGQEGTPRAREGPGRGERAHAGGQGGARRPAGRLLLDLEPGRHRRHPFHADHQRARGGDTRRRQGGDEAGVERQGIPAAADAAACRSPTTTA